MVMYRLPLRIFVVFLMLVIYVQRGLCVELKQAIPEPGTKIEEFADNSRTLNFFCMLSKNETQIATVWFILSAMNAERGLSPALLTINSQFVVSGDIIDVEQDITIPSNTNLTVVGLTTDLHNSTLFCGSAGGIEAEFPLIVYDHPSPPRNLRAVQSDFRVSILWDPPSNRGSPTVSFYSLLLSDEDGTILSNITLPSTEFTIDLLPLTNYSVVLTAVSQLSPVLVISPTVGLNFTTNETVPVVNCTGISTSMDQTSIQIMWDTIHTGGLDITSASIEYAPLTSTDNFTSVVNYSSIDPVEGKATLQNSFTANVTYIFTVSTENDEGQSLPSQCPPIFLKYGAPTTPDTPIVEADGPVALLKLRTEQAGVKPPHSFSFSILVYVLNSTDNTSSTLRRTEELPNSTYRSGDTVMVHVEEIMELGVLYQFAAQAVNRFGRSDTSDLSEPILLNVSVPTISMVALQTGFDGITVSWDFLHTGSSTIDQVEISLREGMDGRQVLNRIIPQAMNDTFLINGTYLQAGLSYQVEVRATNQFGESLPVLSETLQESTVGVPKVPLVPTLYSYNTSSITLTLFTAFSGLLPGGEDEVTFRLRINETGANGVSQIRFQEAMFPADISGVSVQMTVDNVDPTKFYMFSVRAENQFGVSAFSKDSDRISTAKDDEGEDTASTLGIPELIGIGVGMAIAVVLVLLCCLLVVCALASKCVKSKSSVLEAGVDGGVELQDNSLYDRRQKHHQEVEFPPDAYESQYEPSPKEKESVLLRPKPTHPTTDRLSGPQPVYDSLGPSERKQSIFSSGSGKELPNPLYSGLPAKRISSRPTSQQNDSGSGTVRNMAGEVESGGHSEEPLYSEAKEPPANNALYTEPDLPASRTSRRLDSPPPPPPDPSSIPTYAEAGPSMSSQEHLYTELNDPDTSSTRLPDRTPVFHVPPPPPPETAEKYLPDGPQEETTEVYTVL